MPAPQRALPLQDDDPATQLRELRRLLAELTALGVHFRLSGTDVIAVGTSALPPSLHAALRHHTASGLLWSYLGGEDTDADAIDLLEQLDVSVHLVETRQAARGAVRQLIRDRRQHPGPVGIDIETAALPDYRGDTVWIRLNADGALSALQPVNKCRAGLSPHTAAIATLQLYAGGDCAFVFRGEALGMLVLSHWLRRQWLVAHNAAFEVAFLRHHGAANRPASPPRRNGGRTGFGMDCTLQLAGLVLSVEFGGGRSLADATRQILELDVPKALQLSDWSAPQLSPGQIAYAASDAVLTRRLWPELTALAHANDTTAAYELQRTALPAIAAMELRGLLLDRTEHARQAAAWSQELAIARQLYHAATGAPPPSTPNEVRAWLETVLDAAALTSWPRTEHDMLSVRSHHLKRLTHIPSARPVLAILAHEKLLAGFGAKLVERINPATSRLHAHYLVAGAKSGRLTCSNPNLQQLPNARAPEFKRCIVADAGNLLVGCDWNQIELRAAAWLSGDAELTELYAEGRDLHRETAATVAGIAPEDVTREQRQAAKAVNFGSVYGISPRGLSEYAFASYGVAMAEAGAKQALDAFFQRFAALVLVHRRFASAGIRGGLVASVHDELLCEVAEADAARARDLLQTAMIDAFVATFPDAPTRGVATAHVGRTWAAAKGE